MKKPILLFGAMLCTSFFAKAQQQENHNHLSDVYSVSVFQNFKNLKANRSADLNTQTKLKALFPGWMIISDNWTGSFREMNGKPIAVAGTTLLDKAKNIMKTKLNSVGIVAEDWVLEKQYTDSRGFNFLRFTQTVEAKKVSFANMHFRFTPDGKLARVHLNAYGQPDISLNETLSPSEALKIAKHGMEKSVIDFENVASDLEWFPIPATNGYVLHPAYYVSLQGKIEAGSSVPLNAFAYVDAIDGTLLYRDNETKDAIDLQVKGSVKAKGYLNPMEFKGLPHVTVKVGATTLIADDTGFVSSTAFSFPSTATVSLEGPYSQVRSAPDGNITPSFSTNITASGQIDSFALSTKATVRHINAYYHVNIAHDHLKAMYGSSFTGMDYALRTNVDVTGTCNAFYTSASGTSINFFPAGGGCVSFAEVGDVVYHEYGHGIVAKMYGGGMKNGGLNEGQADVWGMSITGDSILARGAYGTPGSYIRRYDLAPKVYPIDLTGEVHANGEIIAGAWWDYGRYVNSVDSMGSLFARTLFNEQPDGPNGTEGVVYHDMLMGALINDDNNSDLSDGTPHMTEIVKAFARHGIYLMQDIIIEHNELGHQANGVAIEFKAKAVPANPTFFKSLNLVYKTRTGTWTTLAMTDKGGYNFEASIPAQSAGEIIDYYFEVKDALDYVGVFAPANFYPSTLRAANQVTLNYQFAVGVVRKEVVDFESTLSDGWQLGISGDDATAGKWIQAVPIGSSNNGHQVQTNKDHTSGSGKCLVTGNTIFANAYTQSVKNGITTVLTPLYDLSAYTKPIVAYYRWFTNDQGKNPRYNLWRVTMATTTTSLFFKDVENTYQSDYQWRRRVFNPQELFPGSTAMILRFIASEKLPSGTSDNGLVEAAIDDFIIYDGIGSTSVDNTNVELAKIYPNPGNNFIQVNIPSTVQNSSIQIFDLSGKLISNVVSNSNEKRFTIQTSLLSNGQYLMVVQMDKTIQNHKITIAH